MIKFRKRTAQIALDDPSLARVTTTPQILDYDRFSNRGRSQYLPYVMSFNAANFTSKSINTDHLGFRFSYDKNGNALSVGTLNAHQPKEVNLLVGASPALGYGSTSDQNSLASRLSDLDQSDTPWLNFAGHCFNSMQELILFTLHSHRLPKVKRIVVMSGFNTLVMARLPDFIRGSLPPFYFCGEYYEKFNEIAERNGAEVVDQKLPSWPKDSGAIPPINETIDSASNETLRCLAIWEQLSRAMGAELTFLMQPLATWVRKPCAQEQILFNELDQLSKLGTWDKLYGDISESSVATSYATKLAEGCEKLNIRFGSLVGDLQNQSAQDWLFVDRAHFTDLGNDIVAQSIQKYIQS